MTAPAPAPAPAVSNTIGSLLKTKTAWGGILIGLGSIVSALIHVFLVGDSTFAQQLPNITDGVGVALGAIGLRGAIADLVTQVATKA